MAPKKGRSAVPTGSCGTDEKHRLRCRLRIPLLHDECNTGLPGPPGAARKRAAVRLTAKDLWLMYSDKALNGQDPEFFNTGGVAMPVQTQFVLSLDLGF